MSGVILGEVDGNDCPKCKAVIPMEGEFSEGDEFNCDCGAAVEVGEIEARYTVYLALVESEDAP